MQLYVDAIHLLFKLVHNLVSLQISCEKIKTEKTPISWINPPYFLDILHTLTIFLLSLDLNTAKTTSNDYNPSSPDTRTFVSFTIADIK